MQGPQTEHGELVHAEKYRGRGETFDDAMSRVACTLAPGEDYKPFRETLLDMRFMPGGRVQSAVGSTRRVTPFNCYVSGTIADSYVAGNGSIMDRLKEAAATMRMGGGIGYDFSPLRPRNAIIKKLGSNSCGPVPFMGIFNQVGLCTASSGHRRGAQMGVLRVDHPDIEEFISVKHTKGVLEGFNLSIAVTDEFMRAVEHDLPFHLRWNGTVYGEVRATMLWERIMRSTWDHGDPGVIFIDRVNECNNLRYCETIAATNPCGEQPLPPYGACLLGSFNLVKYVERGSLAFQWDRLRADVAQVVPAMDSVIDVAEFPLWEQEQEAQNKRRMGLGVTGLANAVEYITGSGYGTREFLSVADEILGLIKVEAYRASALLAAKRGPFAAYDEKHYMASPFIEHLPEDIRELIKANGIRNSHLLSIAPTGTISMAADNVSSGIEPMFAKFATRTVTMATGERQVELEDYASRFLGYNCTPCSEVTAQQHVAVLALANRHVDSAVSKTCNVPKDMAWEPFKDIYMQAWKAGCKGCTTFTTGGKREGILTDAACRIDPATGRRECE